MHRNQSARRSGWRGFWLIVAEVLLLLVIIGLLIATWLPAIIGARPGTER